MPSNKEKTWKTIKDDPDSRVILARRKMLIALALTGATSFCTCGCTKSVQLNSDGSDTVDAGRSVVDSESGFNTDGDTTKWADSASTSDTGTGSLSPDTAFSDTGLDTSTSCGCNGCGCNACGCGAA